MELSKQQQDPHARKFSNHPKIQLIPLTKNWTSAWTKLSKYEFNTVSKHDIVKKYSKNTFKHRIS